MKFEDVNANEQSGLNQQGRDVASLGSPFVALRTLIVLTIITGLLYPGAVSLYANIFVKDKALGSLLPLPLSSQRDSSGSSSKNHFVGSDLIAQKFTTDVYFWGRPSGVDFNTLSSGGSQLSPTSEELRKQVESRKTFLLEKNKSNSDSEFELRSATRLGLENPASGHLILPPQDLLFASGSGLDPHISPEAAYFQVERVAKAREMKVDFVRKLIAQVQEGPQFGLFGENRINVLRLNLLLDQQ